MGAVGDTGHVDVGRGSTTANGQSMSTLLSCGGTVRGCGCCFQKRVLSKSPLYVVHAKLTSRGHVRSLTRFFHKHPDRHEELLILVPRYVY